MHPHRARYAFLALFVTSCSPALRDDGFRAGALARGCHTEEDCRLLIDAARARARGCDTSGHVACDAVAKDFATSTDIQESWRQAEERKHREEIHEREREQADAREAEDDARRRSEAAHDQESRDALTASVARLECERTAAIEACDAAGPGRDRCRAACAESGARREEEAFHLAYIKCLDVFYLPSSGKPACVFPDDPWAKPERQKECVTACTAFGPKIRAYNATHVKCCDGTRSPTCTYATMRSGCCSRHDGACQEEPPRLEH